MATLATVFEGATVSLGTMVGTTAPAVDTFQAIGEILSFDGPGGEAPVINASHNGSTSADKLMGLPDEGRFSFVANYIEADTGQTNFITDRLNRTLRNLQVVLADTGATVIDFKVFPIGFSLAGAVDDKITANFVCEITGPVTIST